MEVTPKGAMLFIENVDVPGVIGRVGTLLGNRDINIAAYLLSRKNQNGKAFAVIRIDDSVDIEDLNELRKLKEVEKVQYIRVNT